MDPMDTGIASMSTSVVKVEIRSWGGPKLCLAGGEGEGFGEEAVPPPQVRKFFENAFQTVPFRDYLMRKFANF